MMKNVSLAVIVDIPEKKKVTNSKDYQSEWRREREGGKNPPPDLTKRAILSLHSIKIPEVGTSIKDPC